MTCGCGTSSKATARENAALAYCRAVKGTGGVRWAGVVWIGTPFPVRLWLGLWAAWRASVEGLDPVVNFRWRLSPDYLPGCGCVRSIKDIAGTRAFASMAVILILSVLAMGSRMRPTVLTMNTGGNWTPANVRESHVAACARWGAEYAELTDETATPFATKVKVLAETDLAERVAWIDGDVVLRSDCPSPFDIVPAGLFGAAPGIESNTPMIAQQTTGWDQLLPMFNSSVQFDPSTYVNGGFFVFEPARHRYVWAWMHRAFSTLRPEAADGRPLDLPGIFEQSGMNIILATAQEPLYLMPRTMNAIGHRPWTDDLAYPMGAYVWHLAAWDRFRTGKRERLEQVKWRLP